MEPRRSDAPTALSLALDPFGRLALVGSILVGSTLVGSRLPVPAGGAAAPLGTVAGAPRPVRHRHRVRSLRSSRAGRPDRPLGPPPVPRRLRAPGDGGPPRPRPGRRLGRGGRGDRALG